MSGSYTDAQLAARARAGQLAEDGLAQIQSALDDYAQTLSAQIADLRASNMYQVEQAVTRARRIVFGEMYDLQQLIDQVVSTGRAASYEEVAAIWDKASRAVAEAEDVPNNLLGAIGPGRISLQGEYAQIGGYGYRSLIRDDTNEAAAETANIVQQALAAGMSPDELARRLRPYVSGAEPFAQAFGGSDVPWRNLQQLAGANDQAAYQLQGNAARIAFSETHNARAEAEVAAFAADPLVIAVRWTLSPNRGTLRRPDICDVLADTDFYGLGTGVYPVARVPVPPHPWDRCERFPIKRSVREAHLVKPNPSRSSDVDHGFGGRASDLTRQQAEALKAEAASLLSGSEQAAIQAGLAKIKQALNVSQQQG